MANPLVSFFKKLGRLVKRVFVLVDKIVPEEQLLEGIRLVQAAATQFTSNPTRRNWVIERLIVQFGIPEYIARLTVELALVHVKNAINEGADKLAD